MDLQIGDRVVGLCPFFAASDVVLGVINRIVRVLGEELLNGSCHDDASTSLEDMLIHVLIAAKEALGWAWHTGLKSAVSPR